MAKNPDPALKLTTSKGVTRTLDDWSTMFHLCLVILPPRPEASVYIPIAERIFQVFGDADCRTALCVVGNEFIAKGVLGEAENKYLCFADTDASGRGGRITRHRWNIVDQSSSVRVTPLVLASLRFGSGFFATARDYSRRWQILGVDEL